MALPENGNGRSVAHERPLIRPIVDHYVRGIGEKFKWRSVLETLEEETPPAKKATDGTSGARN